MAYNKTNWKDTIKDASGNVIEKGTPLAAQYLNKMESGIENATQNAEKAVSDLAGVSQQLAETENQVATIAHTNISAFTGDDAQRLNAFLQAHAGETVRIPRGTYNITSTVEIPANTEVIGEGVKVTTPSHITMMKLNSGVRLRGVELSGAGNATYNAAGRGIEILGIWDSTAMAINNISDVIISDCYIHDVGSYGIYAEYATNIKVNDCKIFHVGYAGVGGISVRDMHVSRTHVKDMSPGTSNNAYGIFFSRKTHTNDFTEAPRSSRCSAIECLIEDNLLWEALDTHGGEGIDFINNTIRNCKTGIAIVGSKGGFAPKDVKAHNNNVRGTGGGVGIIAAGAGEGGVPGAFAELADRISIVGNSLTECGIKGDPNAGGIEFYYTRGTTVVGNTLMDCYPHGITAYHTNYAFSIEGNTVIDPQDASIQIVSGIVVRSTHNSGVISGNSLLKTKDSTAELNVAKRGIYLATQIEIDLFVGANYSNFEIFMNGVEGQAVRFNSLLGNSKAAQYAGFNPPEGVISAPMGSLYINRAGGTGTTFYVKESGSGSTGWVAK